MFPVNGTSFAKANTYKQQQQWQQKQWNIYVFYCLLSKEWNTKPDQMFY